jgi:hypothetical protein
MMETKGKGRQEGPDFSEDYIVSIFRVEVMPSKPSAEADRKQGFAQQVSSLAYSSTLKIESMSSLELSGFIRTARHYNAGDHHSSFEFLNLSVILPISKFSLLYIVILTCRLNIFRRVVLYFASYHYIKYSVSS